MTPHEVIFHAFTEATTFDDINNAVDDIIEALDKAGFAIVAKPTTNEQVIGAGE